MENAEAVGISLLQDSPKASPTEPVEGLPSPVREGSSLLFPQSKAPPPGSLLWGVMSSFQVGAEPPHLSVQFPCVTDSHLHHLVRLPDGRSLMPSSHFGPFSLSFDFFSLPCFLLGHTHFLSSPLPLSPSLSLLSLSLALSLTLSQALICSFFLSPLSTFLPAQSACLFSPDSNQVLLYSTSFLLCNSQRSDEAISPVPTSSDGELRERQDPWRGKVAREWERESSKTVFKFQCPHLLTI